MEKPLMRILTIPLAATCWVIACLGATSSVANESGTAAGKTSRPNFLLIISDDQSWIHTGSSGYAVKTPVVDKLANEGIHFRNAFASAPTCTASRSAILAGQDFWRLGPAAQLWGDFPSSLANYQRSLEAAGYKIGYTGKGWGPGETDLPYNPVGPGYHQARLNSPPGLSPVDYAENFRIFLQELKPGQPFSFWISPYEPHRAYDTGIGERNGISPDTLVLPPFLPSHPAVRSDVADYLYEIQWMDQHIGKALEHLAAIGQLENTVIVFTSDNGMPFPRAKSNVYDYGTHVPLIVRWGGMKARGIVLDDFINLADLAPTFLALAGVETPLMMNGKNLKPLLEEAAQSGQFSASNDATFTGFQRHIANARMENRGYPVRAIHTADWLYIRNFTPERWPAGKPGKFPDIDNGSPSKEALKNVPELDEYLQLATAKRPAEELYDLRKDPGQLNNLAGNWFYYFKKRELRTRLMEHLENSGDPQVSGRGAIFDSYIYHGKLY